MKCDEEELTGDEIINSNTHKYQKHIQNSYGLKFCCIEKRYDGDVEYFNSPDSEEVIKNFIETIEDYAQDAYHLSKKYKTKIFFKNNEESIHLDCSTCYECKNEFTESNIRVAHHNHITGQFINTLCNNCNLNYKYEKFLPVYLHNLKGYDSHLFIKSLSKYGCPIHPSDYGNVSCFQIMNNNILVFQNVYM